MNQTSTKILATEMNKFLRETHSDNLQRIKDAAERRRWDWMLPEEWVCNDENTALVFHAISAHMYNEGVKT